MSKKKTIISLNRCVFNKKLYFFNNYFEYENKKKIKYNLYKSFVQFKNKLNKHFYTNKHILHTKEK